MQRRCVRKTRRRKNQPLRRKFEPTPSPLSQVTTPDGIRGHVSKRSHALSALAEALQAPRKKKSDRYNAISDSDLSLAHEPSPVIGMRKTLEGEELERTKKQPQRNTITMSRAIRGRKLRRRKEITTKFEMAPTQIKKIESPAQNIMAGFPLCNHPLWKQTFRRGADVNMEKSPTPYIPSPLEQMKRQNKSCGAGKLHPNTKSSMKPNLDPW